MSVDLEAIKKRGLPSSMKVWTLGKVYFVWASHADGNQWGFCYSPRLCFNVFLGPRSLSIQWADIEISALL